MPSEGSISTTSINFFRNYTRLVGMAYAAILIVILGFFLYQINQKREEEIGIIQGHVERHGQLFEFILRNSVNHLETMRISVHNYYDSTALKGADPRFSGKHTEPSRLFKLLATNSALHSFHLDKIPEPDETGNLTGTGALVGRSRQFYRDVEMALALSRDFQSINLNLPNAVSSRFVGVENFSIVYPWAESSQSRFSAQDYDIPTWRMGIPAFNPNQDKYWAPVYYGGKDKGLLAPLGAPTYDQNTFRGIVSIDTSLDYLNRINGDFGYASGITLLVDAHSQVLAHPALYANALQVISTPALESALPEPLRHLRLTDIPANIPTEIHGHLVIRHPFLDAPWNLVFILPQQRLWGNLLLEHGVDTLAVVLGLTLLMVATYLVTSHEFIDPANKLVQHIAAESRFQPAPIPIVPDAWRPWFENISHAFQESLQLAGIRQELDIAARMQHSILPHTWPAQAEFALWGLMRSAKEIGGDFYDHFPLGDGRIGIVVADVSDKGVPAALFAMVSKTLIRAIAMRGETSLEETFAAANNVLCEDNDDCFFVTALYAIFDPVDGNFTFVNAGHPPPLLIHGDGRREFIKPAHVGIALGVAQGMPFSQTSITLQAEDCLVMYTDGVTEAFDAQGKKFTSFALTQVFASASPQNVHDAVERVMQAVDHHAGDTPQSDDITCVVLHYHHAAGGAQS